MKPIVARLSEHDRYDINEDVAKVTFMATTAQGTFFAEVVDEGASRRREMRSRFKQLAAESIGAGIQPGEISLG